MFSGHYGAALLAAYFMDEENQLVEHVKVGLVNNCQYYIKEHKEFCVPFHDDSTDHNLIAKVIDGIKLNINQLRTSSHGVILGVLVLKGLLRDTNFLTPSIINGIYS